MNTYRFAIDLIGILFELYITISFFQSIWEESKIDKKVKFLIYIAYGLLMVLAVTIEPRNICVPVGMILCSIMLSFLYKSNLLSKTLFSLLVFGFFSCSELLAGILLSSVITINIELMQNNLIIYLYCVVFSKLLVYIIIKVIEFRQIDSTKKGYVKPVTATVIMPVCSALIIYVISILAYNLDDIQLIICTIVSVVVLILMNIFVFIIINKQTRMELAVQRLGFLEKQNVEQKKHYEELYQNQRETQKIWHDLKNNFIALSGMMEQKKYKEASEYIKHWSGNLEQKMILINTGFPELDAIIYSKQARAKLLHISFVYHVQIHTLNIDIMDLCIVVANALDNAIEACEKIVNKNEKYIRVNIKQVSEYISITVINSIEKDSYIDSCLATTKIDKNNHGFGIQGMKIIAEKYNGDLSYERNIEDFKVHILAQNTLLC